MKTKSLKPAAKATASPSLFLHNLRESGLLAEDQLGYLQGQVNTKDVDSFAGILLGKGWLTRYQLQRVLEGRPRGLVLGQYQILEEVGRGGFGTVYKAVHGILDRVAAVKVMEGERARTPQLRNIFFREVLATTRLTHPNIAVVYEASASDDMLWFAMEFVDGPTLEDYVASRGPLPVSYACAVMHQVARALQFAHEQGMVHRDIKPANLMLPKDCLPTAPPAAAVGSRPVLVKVLDFGLARFLPAAGVPSASVCREGCWVGTPEYASPEQARDSHEVDIRSDLYSLGCTFYYALTGGPPFRGPTELELMAQHAEKEPEPLLRLRPEVPPAVAHLVGRLMAKEREHRFATPADLVQALGMAVLSTREQPPGVVVGPPAEASLGRSSADTLPKDSSPAVPGEKEEAGGDSAAETEVLESWREWLAVVESLAGQGGRPACTEQAYAALHGQLCKGARRLAAASPGGRSRPFAELEALVEPWLTVQAVRGLDPRTLGGLLQTCRRLDTELCGARRNRFAVLAPVLGVVLALASFVLGFLYLGTR